MAEISEQLLGAIDALRYENAQYHDENYLKQGKIVDNTAAVAKNIGDLLDEFRGSRRDAKLDAEEARRDAQGESPAAPGAPEKPEKEDNELDFQLKGILQTLAGIGVAVAGFATGLVQGFGNIVKLATRAFRTRISNIFKPFSRFIDAIGDVFGKRGTGQILKGNTYKSLGRLTGMFRSFADGIKNLETRFAKPIARIKSIGQSITSWTKSTTAAGKDIAKLKIGQAFQSIKATLSSLFAGIRSIQASTVNFISFKEMKTASGLFKKITDPIKNFFNGLKGAADSSSKIGKVLGRFFSAFKLIGRFVAFPLTVIMGIIDGFKGLMAGSKRQIGTFDKIIGGAIGAITGVIKGLVGMPLDLLKSAVSWIAGKLGFENFSAMLDKFSFAEFFQEIGDRLADTIVGLKDKFMYTIQNLGASLMRPFEEGFNFGALIEFVVTLPYKLTTGLLDLLKNGIASLAELLGASDFAATLDGFSFVDTFERIISFVKELPRKLMDFVMEKIDAGMQALSSGLEVAGDFAVAAKNQLKSILAGILPDPDSIAGKLVPNALWEFVKITPPAPVEVAAEAAEGATAPTSQRVVGTGTATDTDLSDANADLEQEKQNLAELQAAYDRGEEVDELQLESAKMFVDIAREYRDKIAQEVGANPQRPDVTVQTQRGQELSEKSKENAQSGAGATNVVVSANAPTNTTNNNSNTAAVIDQNLSTVDTNDRSWGFSYA
jgi:hypothetical protein